ncbi:DNA (cytosine-5-)-methyltransferase [Clostridiaceae bacterium M8S5]|nr:DNA (cytosine-5-)-methyltransferase [Clostridiaceae bacterium M8S5]
MRGGKRAGAGRKSVGNKQVKVVIDERTIEMLNDEFCGKSQSEKVRNCIKYGLCNKKGLRVATVFSGIGAIEHALSRMKINHEIIFASDNGGVNIFEKKINYNFRSIEIEIGLLKDIISDILTYNNDEYLLVLNSRIQAIENKYGNMKLESEKLHINNIIIEKVNQTFLELDEKLRNKALKSIDGEIVDISDYFILVMELRKLIKSRQDLLNLKEELDKIQKDKSFRVIVRNLKEVTKLLSQLHETIGTIEVTNHIVNIDNPREKKKYVDDLYKKYNKSNHVKKMYFDNYDIDEEHFHWNVCFLDGKEYKGKIDLYVGGSPCQSFSIVGKRGGFKDTRGTLFYEYVRILKEVEPRFFIYENVKGVMNHDGGKTWDTMKNTFEETGYFFNEKPYILNSKDFGIPQNRERMFVVGFKNKEDYERFEEPKKFKLITTMKNYLEDSVDSKYYLPEKGIKFVTDQKNINKRYTQINGDVALCQKANQQFNWHGDFIENYTKEELGRMAKIDEKYFLSEKVKNYVLDDVFYMNNKENEELIDLDIARPLTATMHKMHRAGVDNYISYGKELEVKDRRIRKLTPRECFRLMGFCDSFKLSVSDTQLYKQAGNSIVVDVLIAIMNELIKLY